MNFDYTYIAFRHFLVFEPLIIVSNAILLALSLIYAKALFRRSGAYAREMAWFMLMLGVSAIFGAICHTVHYQNGATFFDLMFFGMNSFSLLSAFFCFRATYFLQRGMLTPSRRLLRVSVIVMVVLLIYSFLLRHFLLVKIVAGIALLYTLLIHVRHWRSRKAKGSLLVVCAIVSSLLSIIVHSARISFHEWFNYKDFAHVFMIVAMIYFYRGARTNADDAALFSAEPLPGR